MSNVSCFVYQDHQFSAWLGLGLLMHGKESSVELPMDVQQDLRGFICLVRLVKVTNCPLLKKRATFSFSLLKCRSTLLRLLSRKAILISLLLNNCNDRSWAVFSNIPTQRSLCHRNLAAMTRWYRILRARSLHGSAISRQRCAGSTQTTLAADEDLLLRPCDPLVPSVRQQAWTEPMVIFTQHTSTLSTIPP